MKKFLTNNISSLLILVPLLTIPFLQTKLLLDISLAIRVLAINIWLLVLAFYLLFNRKNNLKSSKPPLNLYFIIYFLYILFSVFSVYNSSNFADGISSFFLIFNFGFSVFLFYEIFLQNEIKIQHFVFLINIFGLIVIFLGFIDFFKVLTSKGINHQSIYEIDATFSHKNILSEILFSVFPFSIYLVFYKNTFFRILGTANFIGILFLIIILITRAVWLSLILGFLATFVLFFILSSKDIISSIFRLRKTYLILFSFLLIITTSLFIYSKLESFETIKKSSQKIFHLYDSSQHRIELWKRTIDISNENPLLGKGLATWKIEVLKYGNRNLQSEDNITFYQRPHNDYLWILAEQGYVGLILKLILYFIIIFYLVKLIKNRISKTEQLFYYLTFLYLFGYLTFSFFSFPAERVEHLLFLGLVFAFIVSKFQNIEKYHSKAIFNFRYNKLIIITFFTIISIFSTYISISRFISEKKLKRAFQWRSSQNYSKVITEIDNSETLFYKIDPFSTPLKWYSGEAYFIKGDIKKAFENFKTSYQINPYHIYVINNLATCYEIEGEHQKAIKLYRDAIDISPKFEDALLNLTAIYFNLENIDSAQYFLSRVDTISNNEKYLISLNTIVDKQIVKMLETTDNVLLKQCLEKIFQNNEWKMSIFRKSIKNNINFTKQLIEDCIYILENIDKSINHNEANQLKNQLLNKK